MKITSLKVINIVYDALSINTYIEVVGGTLTLNYYSSTGIYIPDRTITPLVLNPILEIKDPNNVLSTPNAQSKLLEIKWFENNERITSIGGYTINTDNSLTIKKNSQINLNIRFEAFYLDTRKNQRIVISDNVNLLAIPLMEVESNPILTLSQPLNWILNPLKADMTKASVSGTLFQNGNKLKGMLNWLYMKSDKTYESIEKAPFYISGNYSDTVNINPKSIENVIIKADNNIQEDFKNKILGINPEWDNRMKEVFENRNLILNSEQPRTISGGWLRYAINPEVDLTDKTIIFNYESNDKFVGDIILTNWDWSYTQSVGRGRTEIKVRENWKYLAFTGKDGQVISNVKLIIGNKVTPYTPAPEDLNFRNLITNGDFKQKSNSWLVSQSTTKFDKLGYCEIKSNGTDNYPYIHQYITPNYDLCYISFMYEPPTNGGEGLSLISQKGNSNTTLETINTKEKGHLSIIANLNNGYFRFNQSFSTEELAESNPFSIGNINIINLTQTFGKGNEPTKEQLDEVFKDMPYIPSPEDYAPDGIIKGKYEATTNIIRQFPKTLDVDILGQTRVKNDIKVVTLKAIVSTKEGVITNPTKYFKIIWYSQLNTAGAEKIKVGEGETFIVDVINKRKIFVEIEDLK